MRNALCQCKKRLLIVAAAELSGVKLSVKQILLLNSQASLGH
jgi:hypothetical protein